MPHRNSLLGATCNLFELVGIPALLIGAAGEVFYVNSLARAKFETFLQITNGRLTSTNRSTIAAIDKLARSAADCVCDHALHAVAVHRPNARPLIIHGISLTEDMRKSFEPARGLLLLLDPNDYPTPSAKKLEVGFGLTATEAKLAIRLAAGDDLSAAGRACRISYESARSALKSVFQKTDTHRQVEVVMLISRFAVMPRCFSWICPSDKPIAKQPRREVGCTNVLCPCSSDLSQHDVC
jgi:DNA-binding CsgD family transcriptional regulator